MSKNKKNNKIWNSLLLAVLGLVLILWPNNGLPALIRLIGAALIIIGAVGIIQQVMAKEAKMLSRVCRGGINALFAAGGIWLLVNPGFFTGFIQIVIGVVIILFGLKDLIAAIRGKKHWAFIVLACLSLCLGLFIAFSLYSSFGTLAVFAGIALLYTGIASVVGELGGKKKA